MQKSIALLCLLYSFLLSPALVAGQAKGQSNEDYRKKYEAIKKKESFQAYRELTEKILHNLENDNLRRMEYEKRLVIDKNNSETLIIVIATILALILPIVVGLVSKIYVDRFIASAKEKAENFTNDLEHNSEKEIESIKNSIDLKVSKTVENTISDLKKTLNEAKVKLDEMLTKFKPEDYVQSEIGESIEQLKIEIEDGNKQVAEMVDEIQLKRSERLKELNALNPENLTDESEELLNDYNKTSKAKEEKDYTAVDWFYKALVEQNQGNLKTAIEYYSKAIDKDPEYAVAYNNRGIAYYNQKKYYKAIEDYNKALKINTDYAEAYNNRGIAYDDLKDYDKAIEDYNKALKIKPDSADAYNNRGNAYGDLKEYDKAIEDFNEALKINPDYAKAYNNRGIAYDDLKEYDKAIEDYNKALKINTDDADAYYNRGTAYFHQKKYQEAVNDFKKAIELNSDNTSAYINLIEVLIVTGSLNEATQYIEQLEAKDLDSNYKAISLYLKAIVERLLNNNNADRTRQLFIESLKNDFENSWNFDTFDDWLKEADLTAEQREFILNLTERFREKQ